MFLPVYFFEQSPLEQSSNPSDEYYDSMVNGIELNVREKVGVKIALWINHSDYRDAKDLFFHIKKTTPLPKAVDFDFSQHPRKYYHTKKSSKPARKKSYQKEDSKGEVKFGQEKKENKENKEKKEEGTPAVVEKSQD